MWKYQPFGFDVFLIQPTMDGQLKILTDEAQARILCRGILLPLPVLH